MKANDIAHITLNDTIVALVTLKKAREEIDATVYKLLGIMGKLRDLEDANKLKHKGEKP